MFSGLLVCADCGCNLHFHFNQGNPEIKYFNCSNYKGNRGTCQSTHYIRVDFLEEVVLGEIRRLTKFASLYEDDFLKAVIGHSQQADKVHPYYIDAISSKYARIIEEADEIPQEMMWQMVRDYCAYVRRYSLKEFSPAVQKVMNYVNLNVSEPLTLKSLAAMCFISPSYLSALFKQETGTTLIDYINTQRVNRAAQLLEQNNHSIAAVAEEVGILDVNYFTKIFKKTLGVTPTRYRREHKEK